MNALRNALAFAIAAGLIPSLADAAAPASITVPVHALNGSGESGTAVLTQRSDGVAVVLSLAGAPETAQPTHIHIGSCGKINKAPEYALVNAEKGHSSSVVPGVTLADLLKGHYAINVHKSADDLGTYVACGDIKA